MRKVLKAHEADNDGVRHLRELLRKRSAAQLARRIACDRSAILRWARGERMPLPEWRWSMAEVLRIPIEAWERPVAGE